LTSRSKTARPEQWDLLKKEYPRHLWALERIPRTSPLSKKVSRALAEGELRQGDLDLLWEIAHELELYNRLDTSKQPPSAGTSIQGTFKITSKSLTYSLHGDRVYRVLLQHSDGWWARLELRPDGSFGQDLQRSAEAHLTLAGKVQAVRDGIAVLGGILRRIEHG